MKFKNTLDSIKWGLGFAIILLLIGLFFNIFISNEFMGVGDYFILYTPIGFLFGILIGFLFGILIGLIVSLKKKKEREGLK